MAKILIVDDEPAIVKSLTAFLARTGHNARSADRLSAGVIAANRDNFELVLLDVGMPDGNGLDYVSRFRKTPSSPEVLIMTGLGDRDGAETAIKNGAWGYVEKTNLVRDLERHLTVILQYRAEKTRTREVPVSLKRAGIIGNSPPLQRCLDELAMAAGSDVGVLLTGETGTGKEVFARTLHENSSRAGKSFIVVDCAALPDSLIENTLFGHVKGAFTGADSSVDGLVKLADGGTLFLDEVGELPLPVQKSFLRVLQERRFRPVGSSGEIFSDFRLVAATNRILEDEVDRGTFRRDLLFRLQSFSLHLPPLRERYGDLKAFTTHIIGKICDRHHRECKGFSPDLIEALSAYDWPGNVRELIQVLEQAYTMASQAPILFPHHLPERIRVCQARSALQDKKAQDDYSGSPYPRASLTFQEARDNFEKQYLEDLLLRTGNNISLASKQAGLSRTHFYRLQTKHNL